VIGGDQIKRFSIDPAGKSDRATAAFRRLFT
jgi:hypothetical protein